MELKCEYCTEDNLIQRVFKCRSGDFINVVFVLCRCSRTYRAYHLLRVRTCIAGLMFCDTKISETKRRERYILGLAHGEHALTCMIGRSLCVLIVRTNKPIELEISWNIHIIIVHIHRLFVFNKVGMLLYWMTPVWMEDGGLVIIGRSGYAVFIFNRWGNEFATEQLLLFVISATFF